MAGGLASPRPRPSLPRGIPASTRTTATSGASYPILVCCVRAYIRVPCRVNGGGAAVIFLPDLALLSWPSIGPRRCCPYRPRQACASWLTHKPWCEGIQTRAAAEKAGYRGRRECSLQESAAELEILLGIVYHMLFHVARPWCASPVLQANALWPWRLARNYSTALDYLALGCPVALGVGRLHEDASPR